MSTWKWKPSYTGPPTWSTLYHSASNKASRGQQQVPLPMNMPKWQPLCRKKESKQLNTSTWHCASTMCKADRLWLWSVREFEDQQQQAGQKQQEAAGKTCRASGLMGCVRDTLVSNTCTNQPGRASSSPCYSFCAIEVQGMTWKASNK